MKITYPSEAAIRSLEALALPAVDPKALVEAALAAGDQAALQYLMAGVQLKVDALAERQGAGIRRAQRVQKNYEGRKPGALKMKGRKLDLLKTILDNTLKRHEVEQDDGPSAVPLRDLDMTQLAKDLNLSRTTLYRYIKMAPTLVTTLEAIKKAEGQRMRGNVEGETKSRRKAAKTFKEARSAAGV